MKKLSIVILLFLFACHLFVSIALGYLPWLLFVHGETAGGQLVGAAFLLILVSSWTLWLHRLYPKWKITLCNACGLLGLSLLCLVAAYLAAPVGKTANSNLSSKYLGNTAYSSMSLSGLVPEIDQLKLGSYLFAHVDPILDRKQSGRVRELVLGVYNDLRADKSFRDAGSALGLCYRDVFLADRPMLHLYEYVPRQLNRERYPVLVFLHGSLGNFKGYVWELKRVADTAGVAIVCPSYGAGNWYMDSKQDAIDATLKYIDNQPELAGNSVFLGGISNGGTGVTRIVERQGSRFRGVLLISAVLEPAVIESPGFVDNSPKLPFLILHGNADQRIPVEIARYAEKEFKSNGRSVESCYFPGEDHFLFFSERAACSQTIAEWLNKQIKAKTDNE